MADHLPDDPRQWPDDPFRLLGVEPPATEQDLKRAYARLIRRFKPEHHPEEFRRVREAYEAALQRARWFHFSPPPEPAAGSDPPATTDPDPGPAVERSAEPPPRPAVGDPAAEAWALGVAGDRAAAYARLAELAAARPADPDPALRLYWLLALDPRLDPDRTRHDWLAGALARSRLGGPAAELYRRELSADPEAALFGPYAQLLELSEAAPASVLRVGRERLAAAGLGQWSARMDGDLCALADRRAEFDEAGWLAHLVGVMGYAALDESSALSERCSDLIRCLRHLELAQSWAFDQLDELKARGLAWRRAAAVVPGPVREVVRVAWAGPYGAWRKPLAAAAAWAADDPGHALYELDKAARNADAQPLLVALSRLLDDPHGPAGPEYPPGLIRGLVRAFLAGGVRKEYPLMRTALVRFLVGEAIDPGELVSACAVDAQFITRSLVDHVREDGVLYLVCRTAAAVPS
jgi:hypothetical protein